MRILVYGDTGGSGGYYNHCKGVFGSGVWPSDHPTTFACSVDCAKRLGPLDSWIKVEAHPWPESRNRWLRYLWHIWVYPAQVRRIKPDIEFFPTGNLRSLFRRSVSVTMCRNLLPFDEDELVRYVGTPVGDYWLRQRERQGRLFERSTGVIFLSEYSRKVVLKQFPRIRKSVVIPHGIEASLRVTMPRGYNTNGPLSVLYLSPVYHYKHQCEVVRAVRMLLDATGRSIQLRMVGGGAQEDSKVLTQVIRECRGEDFCRVLPFVNREETVHELRNADLFVFASSCECFPNSLVEAMASRLPIACSDQVGLPEILRDAGVYFDPNTPESIAAALGKLIGDTALRQTCGERAYQYALAYSWKRCSQETVEFLKMIVEQQHER